MNHILQSAKNIGMKYNVSLKVIDSLSGQTIQSHIGHNSATNSMLTGIGHYLIGEGVLNQASTMLSAYIPKYISLGTMGLFSQDEDAEGLPAGIGVSETAEEETRFAEYMEQVPGFSADGYNNDASLNNNREYFGLGPQFNNKAVKCELISPSFPRVPITYRDILSAAESEQPKTIDIIYSAMISNGALKQFRGNKDYIFITEAGLWASKEWASTNTNGANGLLAGYRIVPSNPINWDMTIPANRDILKQQILRVGVNQVVQVIWKLQIGAIEQLTGDSPSATLYWNDV